MARQTAREKAQDAQNEVDDQVNARAEEILADNPHLTPFEAAQNARFEGMNEVEQQIDAAAAGQPAFDAAGNPTVVDTSELNVGSATVTTYPGLQVNPYPPTDYGTNLIVATGGVGDTGVDLADDPTLVTRGYSVGDPMPPENDIHDVIETDGVVDTKDFSRRYRGPNDAVVLANRNKYPSGIEVPV